MITVGEVLKKQRESLSKSIKEVSIDTKIQQRFIEYIESNQFDKFDSSVYAQGFIKIYAKYLNLDEDRILAIYRRSIPQFQQNSSNLVLKKSGSKIRNINITPRKIAILISSFFLIGIIVYIGYQIYKFQSPPVINIASPERDSVTKNETELVSGSVDIESSLFINDTPIELDDSLQFNDDVTLNPGVNIITIRAKKLNSTLESVETVKITYNPELTETESEIVEEDKPNIIKLVILNSSVWVQLNIDDINKLSQIVQTGEEFEYEITQKFSFTTGKIGSTQLFFNEQPIPIKTNSSNIGQLECEINTDNEINCE